MKKQFNRMRQLANQTVGRAEKTEPLSDDLLQVEKRLDLVKQVTHSTHKKLTACLQGQQGAEGEKRSVKSPSKLPLTMLAQCLVEGAAVLGDDSLLGKMLTLCGETEESLAQELLQFEVQIERDVVEPLFVLAEVDIPNIQKQRKHLAKLVLDMDSSRTRFHQSSKSSSHPSTLQPGAKAESLREEMEEAANRMEICRDQLSADMFSFVAKEMDYSNYFQTLIEIQAEYHRKSLEILNSVLPQIKAQQEAWVEKPSFGKSLEDHLNISGREIAFPIEACVTMLLECGMQEEGLFRVAPSNSKLKKLKASLDCGVLDVLEYSADPHAIAGALKSYLRELPEPLMTTELYDEWIQASNLQDLEKRLQGLLCACEKLPTDNLNNFRYLIKFLSKLTEYQDANKMTPGNMAIVLGPNLLWTHTDANITEMMTTVSLQIVGIIEPIIQHADWFFPGDIEFNLTGCYGSPIHNNHNSNFSSMPSPDMDHTERRQQHDLGRRPLSVATDNMMLEFYKKDGIRKIQSMGVRVMDTSWVSRKGSSTLVRKTSSTPPGLQGGGLGPPADSLILEQPGELSTSPSATPPPPPPPPPPMGDPRLGTLKSKELSPVIGHKGIQVVGPTVPLSSCPPLGSQSPHSTEPSPHTLRKGSKKLAPGPPKVPYGGGVSDQSAGGQPSPVSLSPTPPSTPSPYGPACPPGPLMALGASPGGGQPPPPPGSGPYSLSSPPSLAGTLTKSRPGHSKPRQRPSLPPPQPPSAPPPDPELLEGLSPGESMSTDIFNYEIPPINVNLDSLIDEFSGAPCRRYMGYYMADSPEGDAVAEEEPQSTTL
ncbi:rho GTPase-activating protein 44 isoform X2 [Gadus morhua]|uniref:rho GTPase-activating protein 44 isoform X2 n=1 Tax=Gadus morhua TaxID=8049 RepID=UPI0011B3C56C|nr:rho GTPase-activating protein 44-like isoform X2 [Gadus morhua]